MSKQITTVSNVAKEAEWGPDLVYNTPFDILTLYTKTTHQRLGKKIGTNISGKE